jgi:hypothetical protein
MPLSFHANQFPYMVIYRDEDGDEFKFQCWAENPEHAKEQCLNANPEVEIVSVTCMLF